MFKPWIGSEFGKTGNSVNGNRVLILGESHYTENIDFIAKCDPEDTENVVNYLAIDTRYRFFTTLSKLITGVAHGQWSDDENRDFWQSVAFYNFIPVFLPKGGRPDNKTWISGAGPFNQVLAETKPDTIIVCGLELWWWVMNSLPGGTTDNDPNRGIGGIGTGIGVRIPHPTGSRGKSRYVYDTFRPTVANVIAGNIEVPRA